MRANRIRTLFAAVVMVAAAGVASAQMSNQPTYTNPVIEPVAADPAVIRAADGTYYLFSTQDTWGGDDHLMSIFTSPDLVHWTFLHDVFTQPPSWKTGGGGLWAPDISFHDGTYYLYYAYSTWGDDDPGIGLATAKSPAGPWKDLGHPVFLSSDIGVSNSIDPFIWDENGKRTIIWGSFHGIYAVPLSDDGTHAAGEKIRLADSRFEAPYVVKHDSHYYLFVSSGSCCNGANSTYTLWVGRSDTLTGTYVDSTGRNLLYGGAELVIYQNDNWVGAGHNSVAVDDAGTDWLVYHAIDPKNPWLGNGATRRPVLIDRIVWKDGWPVINNGDGPSFTPQPAPVIRKR